jgi:hypothetical protein
MPPSSSRPPFVAARWVTLALALGASACAGPLAEGQWLFDAGRYPQAKQAFASLEGESASWGPAEQAEYALLRGLTLGALGDGARAARWLARAKAIEDASPSSLSAEDALRLGVALASGP